MSALDDYNSRRALEKGRDKKRNRALKEAEKDARTKITNEGRCRNPDCSSRLPAEWHHAVPRSKFGKWDIAKHHRDNAIPLCHTCHMLWHKNEPVLRRSVLLPSEVSFILTHSGPTFMYKHNTE